MFSPKFTCKQIAYGQITVCSSFPPAHHPLPLHHYISPLKFMVKVVCQNELRLRNTGFSMAFSVNTWKLQIVAED